MELTCAFASNDGKEFIKEHFGESRYYYIYKVGENGGSFIKRIPNMSVEEEVHADPAKARSVASILKEENVQVVVARRFGPNIKRIRLKFAYLFLNKGTVEDGLKKVGENIEQLKDQLSKIAAVKKKQD